MSVKRKHSRRLSLFGLGTSQLFSSAGSEEATHQPNAAASIRFSISTAKQQANEKYVPLEAQQAPIRRRLSKKRKPQGQRADVRPLSPPASTVESCTLSNRDISEISREFDLQADQRRPTPKRKSSMNVRAALSSIFIPRPSRKSVIGILDGIAGGRATASRKEDERRTTYCHDSRSPTPPSPEIRPPSGLGQIASSVDLSSYVQEEYEASVGRLSRMISRSPSVTHFVPTPPSDDVTPDTKSLNSKDLFYQPSMQEPSAPSQSLIEVFELAMPYLPPQSLASLASTNREFLHPGRMSLYSTINSSQVGEDETLRRGILRTIAGNSEIACMVKSFHWYCLHRTFSPSSSAAAARQNIPRRRPTFSVSSSPEEVVLARVLSLMPNLETLILQQPHRAILQVFITAHQSSQSSSNGSPISASSSYIPPVLVSLRSLTVSGRTTLSTAFGSILVRFLELHPGIRELNLPDVFCLPNVHSLVRHASSSSSSSGSPKTPPGNKLVPPVPPLPPSFAAMKEKEPSPTPLLPNLTRLSAPLSLAMQLVPGRPLRAIDIELTTNLYEGLRPAEIARSLVEARERDTPRRGEGENASGRPLNWRAARHSRRFGAGLLTPPPSSPLPPSPSSVVSGDEPRSPTWKAARQARRAGVNDNKSNGINNEVNSKRSQTLRELRLRCTGKIDSRTIGRVLIALGRELGEALEVLSIDWSGSESELYSQLTLNLMRFTGLKRLEISGTSDFDSETNDESDLHNADDRPCDSTGSRKLEAKIATERDLVEHWSRICLPLSHIEFSSGRVWRAS